MDITSASKYENKKDDENISDFDILNHFWGNVTGHGPHSTAYSVLVHYRPNHQIRKSYS